MMNEDFEGIIETAVAMGEKTAAITTAGGEYAGGVERISGTVRKIDHAVQRNAAFAEEAVSASEEMNAQAEHMKEFVVELLELVRGREKAAKSSRTSEIS